MAVTLPRSEAMLLSSPILTGSTNTVKEQAGSIDILFVNAGFYELGRLGEVSEEHFDQTFNTNVRGLLFAVQKALPLLSHIMIVSPHQFQGAKFVRHAELVSGKAGV